MSRREELYEQGIGSIAMVIAHYMEMPENNLPLIKEYADCIQLGVAELMYYSGSSCLMRAILCAVLNKFDKDSNGYYRVDGGGFIQFVNSGPDERLAYEISVGLGR